MAPRSAREDRRLEYAAALGEIVTRPGAVTPHIVRVGNESRGRKGGEARAAERRTPRAARAESETMAGFSLKRPRIRARIALAWRDIDQMVGGFRKRAARGLSLAATGWARPLSGAKTDCCSN